MSAHIKTWQERAREVLRKSNSPVMAWADSKGFVDAEIDELRAALAQKEPAAHGDERAVFESSMNSARFFPAKLNFVRIKSLSGRDEYRNNHLQSCWHGWQARAALAQPVAVDAPTCKWTLDDYDSGTWASACGELWSFIDGGPTENRVSYCHHCGGKVAIDAQDAIAGDACPQNRLTTVATHVERLGLIVRAAVEHDAAAGDAALEDAALYFEGLQDEHGRKVAKELRELKCCTHSTK